MRIAAAVLSLLATGCVHCVTFDKLPTGTMWQAPSQSPGDLVHTESGIRVMVDRHQWTSGSSAFNLAQVESGWAPRGNHVHTNNMNLTFDFGELGTGKKEITLRFRDMGGAENFSVNGGPVTRGELSSGSEAGIVWTVVSTPVPGGREGTIEITGPVNVVQVGGQNLWIDDVCGKSVRK